MTAQEALAKWDAGETLWSVEMGGMDALRRLERVSKRAGTIHNMKRTLEKNGE